MAEVYSRKRARALLGARRRWLQLAALALVTAVSAIAEAHLFYWKGLALEGSAPPPGMRAAMHAHLGIALKQLGYDRADSLPAEAQGEARCFLSGRADGRHATALAQCVVRVVDNLASGNERAAERRLEVPFADADQLGESLALVVADLLAVELRDVARPTLMPRTEPPPRPAPKPAELARAAEEAARQARQAARDADQRAREARRREAEARAAHRPPAPAPATLIDVGPTVRVGFTGEPAMGGLALRAVGVALRLVYAGGTLSLVGTRARLGGYELGFFRLALGPTLGVGFRRGRWSGDLGAGLQLVVGVTDAGGYGRHVVASGAVSFGGRLRVGLAGHWWLGLGAEAASAFTRERVMAGDQVISTLDLGSLNAQITVSYLSDIFR